MNFLSSEKLRQTEWKLTTKSLSKEAKRPGLYRGKLQHWALPVTHAKENLFEGIRDEAIAYFNRNRIWWHAAAQIDAPTNHLCSSQVMLVNCLFPFIHAPEELRDFLEPVFPDIEKVLPIESPDQYIAFEWIGPHNYLHEEPKLGKYRRRGLGTTSIDFAILVQTSTLKKRMILGEWKYVESYSKTNIRFRSDTTDRLTVYAPILESDNSPILISKLSQIDDLFYDPIYQAVRHILMAHEIKKHHPEIDDVIVLHFRSERNRAILENPSPGLIQGDTVYDAIRCIMREPGMLVDVGYEGIFELLKDTAAKQNLFPIHYLSKRYRI
jgi:hypothetical protein